MTTQELIGPLPSVRFRDGTKVAYQPPRDTVDGDRWQRCTEHRVACDCREAEHAEEIAELRSQLAEVTKVAREVLAGHATWAWETGPNGERAIGCMCTGCQIVRAAHLLPSSENSPLHRDETDGLTDWQRELEYRWKVCVDCPPATGEPGELGPYTRDRGHYHEHLRSSKGSVIRHRDPEWTPF